MYRCVCDWLGLPYKEEVQWVSIDTCWSISALMLKKKTNKLGNFLFDHQDVDTIYLTQDTRELNLQDFSHLENRCVSAVTGTGIRKALYL